MVSVFHGRCGLGSSHLAVATPSMLVWPSYMVILSRGGVSSVPVPNSASF